MPFTAKPLVGGDLLDASEKLSGALDRELAPVTDPAKRQEACGRTWNQLVQLGLLATIIPENRGGPGGTLLDLAGIVEGSGRNALPLPVVALCGVTPMLLSSLEPSARNGEVLEAIAAGRQQIPPVSGAPFSRTRRPSLAAATSADGYLLRGEVLGVEIVMSATSYAVVCRIDEGDTGLFLVPADADGVTIHHRHRMDGRLSADIRFTDTLLRADDLLARGEQVDRAIQRGLGLGAVLTSVEAIAAMGSLIEQTIAYLSGRVQFGVELSTFQVLRHNVADMYVAYLNARALVDFVLRKSAAEDVLPWREIGLAKFRVGEVGRFVAESAIQLHGGMGMTEEILASRLSKRILMADVEYGDRMFHAGRLLAAHAA